MDNIFKDFRPRVRNNYNKEKKVFDRIRKKWISAQGDIISLYNVYQEFKKLNIILKK